MTEAWAKCPQDGCPVHVYGPITTANPCREHGGAQPHEDNIDIYGNPLGERGRPSTAAPRAPLEV